MLKGLPGVRPSPAVVSGQVPVIAEPIPVEGWRTTMVDRGNAAGAWWTWQRFAIQCPHRLATQRACSLFRDPRSASFPRSESWARNGSGTMRRQASQRASRSRSSAKANSDSSGEAMSAVEPGDRIARSTSRTRSVPLFLMSLMDCSSRMRMRLVECPWQETSIDADPAICKRPRDDKCRNRHGDGAKTKSTRNPTRQGKKKGMQAASLQQDVPAEPPIAPRPAANRSGRSRPERRAGQRRQPASEFRVAPNTRHQRVSG